MEWEKISEVAHYNFSSQEYDATEIFDYTKVYFEGNNDLQVVTADTEQEACNKFKEGMVDPDKVESILEYLSGKINITYKLGD